MEATLNSRAFWAADRNVTEIAKAETCIVESIIAENIQLNCCMGAVSRNFSLQSLPDLPIFSLKCSCVVLIDVFVRLAKFCDARGIAKGFPKQKPHRTSSTIRHSCLLHWQIEPLVQHHPNILLQLALAQRIQPPVVQHLMVHDSIDAGVETLHTFHDQHCDLNLLLLRPEHVLKKH